MNNMIWFGLGLLGFIIILVTIIYCSVKDKTWKYLNWDICCAGLIFIMTGPVGFLCSLFFMRKITREITRELIKEIKDAI